MATLRLPEISRDQAQPLRFWKPQRTFAALVGEMVETELADILWR